MANMTTQEILQGIRNWALSKIGLATAKTAYCICTTRANVAAKTTNLDGYVLSLGGSIKILMSEKNTANNATLNINSTEAKPLYYDGERASANNSWKAGETVEVYYDGTSYYANNVAGGGKFATGEKVEEVGIDEVPTAGSDNLVKSGGVYNFNNLFTHPIANRVIKELYIPGVDYTSVYKLQLCIAALHEGRYYNRIWLFYTLDGTSKPIVIYSKTFDTESEALEDISNMQGLRHSLGSDYYAIISADASMAGTILWDVAISVNKDFADLNNSPILKGYIDSLDRFKGERVLYIKSNGTLSVPSGVSRIFTTYVIAGKKYKIVSEAEDNNNRCVSFTSDFDGYAAIPHDVGGTSNVISFYHIGTNVYTAPAGAKYMHITTQFRGDTNSLPYVSIREYESDLADIHADIQSDLADLADIQADIQADLADIQTDLAGDSEKYYYTDDTIPGSLYASFGAELGTTFVQASYNLEGWYCLKLNVHKGEQIQVCASTKISTRQRPYVLTNLQNKVIRTSPVGGDFTTADTFTAESDGYLYVNNNSARLPMSNFFVKVAIHGLTLDKLREISIQSQEIVSDLASRIIPDDNNPLAVVKQTPGLTSILHRIGVVGASFTNGGHDRTNGIFGVEAGREFSWPQRLARLCGITCFNFGQSGYWCKYWLDNNGGYYDAVAEPENKCDAYIISFASNDKPSKSGYDLGTIDDVHVGNESENGASYYGYFSQVIARCHEVQQRAYLFVLTYPAGYDITESGGYTQAMRDVVDVYKAAGYKIYLIDYASYGMSAAEATAKNLKRGTHYVSAGYQYMTYEICTYIDWIIRQNIKDFEDAAFVRTTAEYVPTGGTPVGYDKNDFFVGPEHNKYLNIDYRRPRFYYTKDEIDAMFAGSDTPSGIPTKLSDLINDTGFITKSVNNLTNYYLKGETYTKAEVAALIGAIQQFHYEIYASTSDVITPANNVLYLIGPASISGSDKYEEYVYANNTFVKIGDTSIDLSGYVTITALNTALADYTTTANLTALLSGKVDKVANAINGNLAGLDANGNLTDSGIAAGQVVASTSVRTIVTLTQAQYDALATKDANTEYNII